MTTFKNVKMLGVGFKILNMSLNKLKNRVQNRAFEITHPRAFRVDQNPWFCKALRKYIRYPDPDKVFYPLYKLPPNLAPDLLYFHLCYNDCEFLLMKYPVAGY